MKCKANAKINLSLKIVNRRDDGYHTIESIINPVDLYDVLTFNELNNNEIIVTCDDPSIPTDGSNLVYKAAKLIKDEFEIKKGIKIDIEKRIPSGAGLGGGSADAACVIKSLNKIWDLNLDKNQMFDLGIQIGSDIPYCINSKSSIVKGIGEQVYDINKKIESFVLLVNPGLFVSTKEVYQGLNINNLINIDTDKLVSYIKNEDYNMLCRNLKNNLEDYTLSKYPKVNDIKQELKQLDFDGVLMSGSGSTVFGLTRNKEVLENGFNYMIKRYTKVYKCKLI